MINWIEEFPYRTGGVLVMMKDKKTSEYKVVDDEVKMGEYTCHYDELPWYVKEKIEKGNILHRELPDGKHEIYSMTRATFKNVYGFIYKDDLIKDFENDKEL